MSCEAVAEVLLLDDDTIRAWHRLYQEDGITETLPRTTHEVGAWIAREFGIDYQGSSGLTALLLGHIDRDGHKLQDRLANQLPTMLQDVAACARRLALAGRRVRIVTDHGWLLMPGGLPVAKIGAGLTESKWSRCAMVKDGSAAVAQQLPWTWNAAVMVATAPGAHGF